jgi:hypothetical protein
MNELSFATARSVHFVDCKRNERYFLTVIEVILERKVLLSISVLQRINMTPQNTICTSHNIINSYVTEGNN